MRDCHIIHAIESLGIGGAQAVLFELYWGFRKQFPNCGQSVVLLCPEKVSSSYVRSYGIEYEPIRGAKNFEKFIKSKANPIIIFHKLMASNMHILNGIFKIAPIVTINHTYTENAIYNRIQNTTSLVSVSNHMHNMLSTKFHVSGSHYVIHNGVSNDKFESIEPAERPAGDVLLTGRINSFNSIKYSDKWVKWCSRVELPKPMVHDYIGGGGGRESAVAVLESIGETRNKVRLTGVIKSLSDKIARIKSWDLMLYSINRHEGVSMSVLESLACGVPVICSNHYGNKEIIDIGVNGYLFDSYDEAADILRDLINNPEKMAELKRTTKEHFAEKLDSKFMVERYSIVMEETFEAQLSRPVGVFRHADKKKLKKRNPVVIHSNIKKINAPNNIGSKSFVKPKRQKRRK